MTLKKQLGKKLQTSNQGTKGEELFEIKYPHLQFTKIFHFSVRSYIWVCLVQLTSFNTLYISHTERYVWAKSKQHDSIFVTAGKANCSFQLPNPFLAGPIHTIKLKLTGDVNAISSAPKDIVTENPSFPLGLVWFCCYHWSNESDIHCPLPFNGNNNCQPAWTVMLKSRKSLFNHGPCISIQAPAVEH